MLAGSLLHRLCLAAACLSVTAFPQGLLWSQTAGSDQGDDATAIAVDADGNSYATGYIRGSVDGKRKSNKGDVYLVKFDRDGRKAWARTLGSDSAAYPRDVAVDAQGDVYVVGEITGPPIPNHQASYDSGFVVKYRGDGNRLWTRILKGQGRNWPQAVAVGRSGSIYVGENRFEWNGREVEPHPVFALSKIDPKGDMVWTRTYGKPVEQAVYDVAVDPSENVYLLARTDGAVEGFAQLGQGDMCLLKYDGSGTLVKTWQYGTGDIDFADRLAIDSQGNIFLAGATRGRMGSDTVREDMRGFLIKLDPKFNLAWTRFCDKKTLWQAVAVDAGGHAYVGGTVQSGAYGVPSGHTGFLVAKFDGDGTRSWLRITGRRKAGQFGGLAVDKEGYAFLVGSSYEMKDRDSDIYAMKFTPVSPSFDCEEAKSPQETMICRSPALSALDDSIATLYSARLKAAQKPGEIKAQQKDWIKNQRDTRKDETQLAQCMRNRMEALR